MHAEHSIGRVALTLCGKERMSIQHRAFDFDWAAFSTQLQGTLEFALQHDDATVLRPFIDANCSRLIDPDAWEPIGANWTTKHKADTQSLADIALTKFYDPTNDNGIGHMWPRLGETLSAECQIALLGSPIGAGDQQFDPGRMGSYFQTSDVIVQSIAILADCADPTLTEYRAFLKSCMANRHGVYVTF